jgi:sarcosine oxidase, subunit alpha
VVDFPTIDGTGTVIKARIVDPVFYDKEGAKGNV